jgi:predicted TIM-barrel fold metal-dependent hydrolase
MANTWDETGRVWDDDHTLLSADELAQCVRADGSEPFRSPIPTRMVSNGEYMPAAQTRKQMQVEARIAELTESASRKLGISRRRFLRTTGGMAASLIAMNEVFGRFFDVHPVEMFEPAAYAQSAAPSDLFVFDDQLHMVRGNPGSLAKPSPAAEAARNPGAMLRALAQGPSSPGFTNNPYNMSGLKDENGEGWGVWNPALVGLPNTPATFQIVQFIKDVYLDSQISIGLLSNVTASLFGEGQLERLPGSGVAGRAARNPKEAMPGELLTAAQTAAARDFINGIAGSLRMLAHGMLYVGKGNLENIQEQIENNKPDSWKGYNISYAAKVDTAPNSLMRQWRHDDEQVAYPTFELIEKMYARLKDTKPGFNNICVHKGLTNTNRATPEMGHPADLPKAARDWPGLNFITYHACIQPAFFLYDSLRDVQSGTMREGVPDIRWTTEYATLVAPFKNTYAEIGTTWASSVITFPTVAAHIMGQLMKFMGPERIVFGSDSVWYGSPQWQIDALWRFQIPEAMREKYGYPELTPDAKRKILGLNSAKLYGIALPHIANPVPADYEARMPAALRNIMELPLVKADNMTKFRDKYAALGAERENKRYGWIRA